MKATFVKSGFNYLPAIKCSYSGNVKVLAGYGAYAHLVRWLNRGAVRVVVDVFSNSTGKLVGRAES